MALYELGAEKMTTVVKTTFAAEKVDERYDLQRVLVKRIETIIPDSMVLAEEFSRWEDSKRRIDILVLDKNADLVVVELKRTEEGGHMELQALRYAAMISAMTFEQAVDAHGQFLAKQGIAEDPQERILSFLDWDEIKEDAFAQDIRIILASADFSKELTTTVLWLNDYGIDITCIRMVPYSFEGRLLLDVQQIIPLPEAEEYQVRLREKATQERVSRNEQGERGERNVRFWASLLKKANEALTLHQSVSPSPKNWVTATEKGFQYAYLIAHGKGRVVFSIARSGKDENKAIFDELSANKGSIEEAFGEKLTWLRLDDSNTSRIAKEIECGSVDDEATWEELQAAMVACMKRFATALQPYVEKYK